MSLNVTYPQSYAGGPGQDKSLDDFNLPLTKTPSEPSKTSQGSGFGSAEANADKTITMPSDLASTNFGGQVSSHSTVQQKTVATLRGDE
jgi:hypothetical protein